MTVPYDDKVKLTVSNAFSIILLIIVICYNLINLLCHFFFNWKSAYYEFILIQPSGMPLGESVFQLVDEGVVNVPNELTLSNQ